MMVSDRKSGWQGEIGLSEEEREIEQLYRENIIDHYRNPRHKWEMSDYSVKVLELNPLCGDRIELFLKVDGGKVIDVSFQGDGCAISHSSMSMLTEKIIGVSIQDVGALTDKDISEMLGVKVSPSREKCATLGLRAVHRALRDLEEQK